MIRRLKKVDKKLLNNLIEKWKIVRGDKVQIIAGKDKGKQGIVKRVIRKKNRLIVEGLNLVKKHVKKQKQQAGFIFTKEAPIHYSNVMLVDPVTGVPTRVALRYLEDGTKVRVSKKTGNIIPRPDILKKRKLTPPSNPEKDTPLEIARKRTLEDSELEDLKNRKLAQLEAQYLNTLKQKYEQSLVEQAKRERKIAEFNKQVFDRARQIVAAAGSSISGAAPGGALAEASTAMLTSMLQSQQQQQQQQQQSQQQEEQQH